MHSLHRAVNSLHSAVSNHTRAQAEAESVQACHLRQYRSARPHTRALSSLR